MIEIKHSKEKTKSHIRDFVQSEIKLRDFSWSFKVAIYPTGKAKKLFI